jgi:acyl-CoA thioester hydrolase
MGMSPWSLHPLRVRYQETDQMRVVFHTNYLNWFEIGRTEWMRRSGVTYRELEERGLLFPVTDIEASFLQPARYDDWVTVCTRVAEWTPLRMRFESAIVAGDLTQGGGVRQLAGDELPGTLLVRGGTRHAWVNADFRPVRLDRAEPELYRKLRGMIDGGAGAQG